MHLEVLGRYFMAQQPQAGGRKNIVVRISSKEVELLQNSEVFDSIF